LAGRAVDADQRNLAEEAAAHVRVQEWIDDLADRGKLPAPTSISFIAEVHRRFYEGVPDELKRMEHAGRILVVEPGSFRQEGQEVKVGDHYPPSAHRLDAFLAHFEKRYDVLTRSATGKILAIPAAHHRLNYIHPFLDGNGRVSRLMSHAMFRVSGTGAGGLWSISRGLARGLKEPGEYKARMAMADRPRQGDRDGRGNLSMDCLLRFTGWFLTVSLDQIRFTNAILGLGNLSRRYLDIIKEVMTDKHAAQLAEYVFKYGELPRGDADVLLKTSERTARNTVSALVEAGFLKSETAKSPLRVSFPDQWREKIFPNLLGTVDLPEVDTPDLPQM
jgi:Fic family protein